jgi:hypothetical protein
MTATDDRWSVFSDEAGAEKATNGNQKAMCGQCTLRVADYLVKDLDLALCTHCYDRWAPALRGLASIDLDGQAREKRILLELEKLQIRDEAKRLYDQDLAGEKPQPYSTPLAELLAEPDDDPQYRIDGVWPTGGKLLFAAQYKAGKTTLVGNAIRCLADGDQFLGQPPGTGHFASPGDHSFSVRQLNPGEAIFIADLELDRRTLRRWLRDQNIYNTDRVRAESFRGKLDEFDILDPARLEEWAQALRSWAIKILVVDPIGPLLATYGFSEESNTDVSKVLAAIDTLAADAGIEEVLLVHHMGHSGERSRGASVFRGWPDAEWRLVYEETERGKEPKPDAARFFIAQGRDVAVPESRLEFDPETRHLSIAGGNRAQHAATKNSPDVLKAVTGNPGANKSVLEQAWVDAGVSLHAGRGALKTLIADGKVHTYPGKQRAIHHVLSDQCEAPTACLLAKKEAGLDD